MVAAVSASLEIPATVTHKPWKGVMIQCFGRPNDFRIKNWHEPHSFELPARQARAVSVKTLWIPQPTEFNAKIARPTEFLQRHRTDDGISVRFGVKADGVELSSAHHGLWISPADCPTLVVYDLSTNRLMAAHAGRDCLIDRHLILSGQVTRRPFSIVDTILQRLDPENPLLVKAFVCCGIGPNNFTHPWDHPEYGEDNRAVTNYLIKHYGQGVITGEVRNGCINMRALIRQQFVAGGYELANIEDDHSDTFTDRDQKNYRWWSCRRGDRERNGVLVARQ